MSTYQPQPLMLGEPSRSQPQSEPSGATALQRTLITDPAAAACTAVPLAAAMSTPWCVGRAAVREPEMIRPFTGAGQPDAEISPAATQRRSVSAPTARAAPPVNTLTMVLAISSCLA